MSKLVKGLKKIRKKIIKGLKTGFRSITKSTIGKVLMFAATVYLGGAALGAWNSPFSSINGALAGGQAAAGAGAEVAAGAEAAAAVAPTTGQVGSMLGVEGSVADVMTQTALAEGVPAAAVGPGGSMAVAERVGGNLAQGYLEKTGAQKAGGSLFEKAIGATKSVGKFANENKLLTAMGINAVSGAVAAREAEQAEREERRRMQRNLSVGNIDLGISPGGHRAAQPGLVSRNIRG